MKNKKCFVVMPFSSELNFFYLYLQKYLSEKHGLHVERGDHRILTKPLMDKIRDQVLAADIIIGEITGGNPNVFYELGLAHAFGKPVIFLTRDPVEKAPVDIKQFEYIYYDLSKHENFLKKLDNAIYNAFIGKYNYLYEIACDLLHEFNRSTGSLYEAINQEEFQIRVIRGEQTQGLPDLDNKQQVAEFLLPKIIKEPTDLMAMKKITEWLMMRNYEE